MQDYFFLVRAVGLAFIVRAALGLVFIVRDALGLAFLAAFLAVGLLFFWVAGFDLTAFLAGFGFGFGSGFGSGADDAVDRLSSSEDGVGAAELPGCLIGAFSPADADEPAWCLAASSIAASKSIWKRTGPR